MIIGNGAAAIAALEAIRRVDADSPVTMIAEEEGPAYSKVLTPYVVSGRVADPTIRGAA